MSSRLLRFLAMGACASALALIAASCGSATSPTIPATGTGGSGGGGGGGGGGGAGGSGTVKFDFSACPQSEQPVWAAYQDGTGAWTAVTDSNHVYRLDLTQSKGGFAFVWPLAGITTFVWYFTRSEFTSNPFVICTASATNSMHGTVAGLVAGQQAEVSLAEASAVPAYPTTNYTLSNMLGGSFDLVAWETTTSGPSASDRVIIRRNVAVQNGGSIPVLDFSSAEAKSPATGTITVTNAVGNTLYVQMGYWTGGSSCIDGGVLYGLSSPTSTFTAYGVPASLQSASDFHSISVNESSGNNSAGIVEFFHTMGNLTETFAPPLPQPTMSVLSGSYKRLQAAYIMPADYNAGTGLSYNEGLGGHEVSIWVFPGYFSGTSVTVAMPDLSKVSGFQTTWEPATGVIANWAVSAGGTNFTGPNGCQEGSRSVTDEVTGSN